MDQEKRRRLPIDQAESRSTKQASLQKKKERLSENSAKFNSNFKFYYDRKRKAIILRTEELAINRRFVSLSATETMVLRTVQELSGFKKKITASDLMEKIILRGCDLETIRNILRTLVKKRILESEKITIQDRVIEVFKTK